jgi:hypothetical protein
MIKLMARIPILILLAVVCAATVEELQSAKRKAQAIEADRVPPQGSVSFTPGEVNAYAAEEVRKEVPDGLRSPKLELGAGTARGMALIDFGKIQTAKGSPSGLLLGMLLRGERQVAVDVAVQSENGTARVDVQSVSIGSAKLSGRALEMVIEYYVLPRYPDAAIGRPFQLRHNIKQVTVSPAGVNFSFGPPPPPPAQPPQGRQ